ncbi:DNA-binding transcriptional regulator [Shigella flexneri]|nr:DNA-binding transcriptional regulator [Shigella flexneri]
MREDTSRTLPKRITWLLDNQKRLVVPDWESSATCISAGLCIGMVPTHFAKPWLNEGKWVALELENPFPEPALTWLLEYLGDSETLNKEWLREPEETPATGD